MIIIIAPVTLNLTNLSRPESLVAFHSLIGLTFYLFRLNIAPEAFKFTLSFAFCLYSLALAIKEGSL